MDVTDRLPEPFRRAGSALLAVVAGVVGAAVYGWWLVGLEPFAWPSTVAVSVPAVVTIAVVVRRQAPRAPVREWFADVAAGFRRAAAGPGPEERRRARLGVLWGVLILTFSAVQLFAYFAGWGHPRREYPTLSWIVGHIESRSGRTALFVAWMAFGASLVRR